MGKKFQTVSEYKYSPDPKRRKVDESKLSPEEIDELNKKRERDARNNKKMVQRFKENGTYSEFNKYKVLKNKEYRMRNKEKLSITNTQQTHQQTNCNPCDKTTQPNDDKTLEFNITNDSSNIVINNCEQLDLNSSKSLGI